MVSFAGLIRRRLFVYHADHPTGPRQSETFNVMERRLLRGRWRKDFAADRNTRPARYCRCWNQVLTLLVIAIVFPAVLKPF